MAPSNPSHHFYQILSFLPRQEAWKNTAFAYELGKCLVCAKKKERDHLLQEPRCNRFERIVATVLFLR